MLSVHHSQLSEVAELRWDGAIELIRVELPEIGIINKGARTNSYIHYLTETNHRYESTAVAAGRGCRAEPGWCQ